MRALISRSALQAAGITFPPLKQVLGLIVNPSHTLKSLRTSQEGIVDDITVRYNITNVSRQVMSLGDTE